MTTRSKGGSLTPAQEQRAARNTIHRHALNAEDELTLLRMAGLEPTPTATPRPIGTRPPRRTYEPKPTEEPDPIRLLDRPSLPCRRCERQLYKPGWPAAWKWGRTAQSARQMCFTCYRLSRKENS